MTKESLKRDVATTCAGCINACPMIAEMEGDTVVRVKGMPGDYRTDGTLCAKGIASTQLIEDPRRVIYPMRRAGERGSGKWERVSWDDALNELAAKIKEAVAEGGPWSVFFLRGMAPGWGFPYAMLQRLAHCIGTEPAMGASECFVPRAVAQALSYGGVPMFSDYDHADLIIFWGRQPANSGAPCMRHIYDARDRGAKIVSIDPLRWHMAATSDQYIQVEPGTDMALALGMIHTIVNEGLWDQAFVDQYTNDPHLTRLKAHVNGQNRTNTVYSPEWAEGICGVDAEVIKGLAREYATTKRASLLTGHGLEGRTNVCQTERACDILRIITGHIDNEGGELLLPMSPALDPDFTLISRVVPDFEPTQPAHLYAVPPYTPEPCTFPLLFMAQGIMPTCDAFRLMDEGKVKVAVVDGGSPITQSPEPDNVRRYFSKIGFIAFMDLYISADAAECADLVLPAASYMERTNPEWFKWDMWTPTATLRQTCTTVGESLPDTQIILKLGRALGFTEEFPTEDIRWYIDKIMEPSGITLAQLEEHPDGVPFAEITYRSYEKNGFACPDGKAQVFSDVLAANDFDPFPVWYEGAENPRSTPEVAEKYPLIVFTGRTGPMFTHTQRRTNPWLRELAPEPCVYINPIKARELNIADGDKVIISSPRGEITSTAWVNPMVKENWLYVSGGWAQSNYNDLGIEAEMCPITSQSNYTSCLGNIRKA